MGIGIHRLRSVSSSDEMDITFGLREDEDEDEGRELDSGINAGEGVMSFAAHFCKSLPDIGPLPRKVIPHMKAAYSLPYVTIKTKAVFYLLPFEEKAVSVGLSIIHLAYLESNPYLLYNIILL